MNIRSYQPRDLPMLYRICLATGAAGSDATGLYRDTSLVGHVYAAPYAVLAPECCFVVEDGDGVGGYIVGASETPTFESRLDVEWWPGLRRAYPPPRDDERNLKFDLLMRWLIHHPFRTPARICAGYPSHLHINLMPQLQGRGGGRRLVDAWLTRMRDLGSRGAHLAVGTANARAVAFYQHCGFSELERSGRDNSIIWFGIAL
jgi:ribosomal protein S18 acetylase RimI-like enzyme